MGKTEDRAKLIFGERASRYTDSPCHTDPAVLAEVVRISKPESDWKVLDVGTGTGHTAFALAPHVAHVTGIDLTPQMLKEAMVLKEKSRTPNVDFIIADVHNLPFRDQVFDLVTCRRAAHHFSDIINALSEMRRVLTPNGRLIIDDRSVPEDRDLDSIMNRLDIYHDESHVREYPPSEWITMLENLDFVVENMKPYIKYRPITALTDGVSEGNIRNIYVELEKLDPGLKQSLNLREIDGQLYLNHWYVLISAQVR